MPWRPLPLFILSLATLVHASSVVPEPQQMEFTGSDTRFGPEWTVSGDPEPSLREEIELRFGLPASTRGFTIQLRLKPRSVVPAKTADPDQPAIAAQAYQLVIA